MFGAGLRVKVSALLLVTVALAAGARAEDKTFELKLPRRSKPTPVQKLNREGVKALEQQKYARARHLFYQAYLLDPNDPFTLNNLGYIAEMEGDGDRAGRYYELARQQNSDAAVDMASEPGVAGQPVSKVAGSAAETGMQVNRVNMAAIGLLLKDRAPEADLLLRKALEIDRSNPFTLNNMGFTKEKEGELEAALEFYTAAAGVHSKQPVVVTANRDWRGKPISDVAAENADKLRKLMHKQETAAAKVARLNLQGVSAMNRNDRQAAREFFRQAYALDPDDAFTLNNMGYVAEMEGDRETADFYYEKAREAKHNKSRVTIATRRDAEGRPVAAVAETSNQAVEARMEQELDIKRQQNAPIELRTRGTNTGPDEPPSESSTPPAMAAPATNATPEQGNQTPAWPQDQR